MIDTDEAMNTAHRMLSMYGKSKYTPYERATDHAFAHDSHTPERKFWLKVLEFMYAINQGEINADAI